MAKKILICQESNHNKFWSYETSTTNSNVATTATIKWGRLGGSSQQQIKTFPNEFKMMAFLNDKVSEKIQKGYKEVNAEKLNEEVKVAEELGQQYKVSSINWVAKIGNKLKKVTEYDADKFVLVEIMNSWTKEIQTLLISKTTSGVIDGYSHSTGMYDNFYTSNNHFVEAVRNYLKKLFTKVKEIVHTVAAGAVGVRKLDLGFATHTAVEEEKYVEEVSQKINDSSASKQVIATFAAMGNRLLDI